MQCSRLSVSVSSKTTSFGLSFDDKKLLKAFRSKFKKNQNWMFWETKMLVLPCYDKRQKMEISLCNLGYKCWIVIYYILKLKSIICCDISVTTYWIIFRLLSGDIYWSQTINSFLSKILKWLDQIMKIHTHMIHSISHWSKSGIPKAAKFQLKTSIFQSHPTFWHFQGTQHEPKALHQLLTWSSTSRRGSWF